MDTTQEGVTKLHLLLQQINLTEDVYAIHFEHALLERVSIHRKSKVWQFNLILENPLPVDVFTIFSYRINEAFSAIATIRLHITTRALENDPKLIAAYWSLVTEELRDMSPPIERLTGQQPVMIKKNNANVHETWNSTIRANMPHLFQMSIRPGFARTVIDFKLTRC